MAQRKLIVEVCSAHNLMPKDGEGSCSAYVQVEFNGQRRRTKTRPKDVNPVWSEIIEFWVSNNTSYESESNNVLSDECIEATVYNDRGAGRRPNFLGRVCIHGSNVVPSGQEAVVVYTLEKRSLFSHIRGELALRVFYYDEAGPEVVVGGGEEVVPPPPPMDLPVAGPPPTEMALSQPETTTVPPPEIPAPAPTPVPVQIPAQPHYHPLVPQFPGSGGPPPPTPPNAFPRPVALDPFSVRRTSPSLGEKITTYDLIEKMYYLFVRVVKARHLAPTRDGAGPLSMTSSSSSSDPFVRLHVANVVARTHPVRHNLHPEWNQVFAFGNWDSLRSQALEASVWDEAAATTGDDFMGAVFFDLREVPKRVAPDSPLAPQWYRLEAAARTHHQHQHQHHGRVVSGELMLAVWVGTQADEAFAEAWQSDTGGYIPHTRAKVYLSPSLWYLRVAVLEAQDLHSGQHRVGGAATAAGVAVRIQLGFQALQTRPARTRSANPFWAEDLILIAPEPFEAADHHLHVSVVDRIASSSSSSSSSSTAAVPEDVIGHARIPLATIERRVDARLVGSKWFNLHKEAHHNHESGGGGARFVYRGRVHLRLCFDGGYHVMDETAQLSSDFRPTARQLWPQRPVGYLELGVLRAQGLLPMKTKEGRGATDAYCVAKYGPKWVRTRTVLDSFAPEWNEQYTWEVYDPCTVLTLGVFDNSAAGRALTTTSKPPRLDTRVGKVRIRISSLQTGKIYTHSYPLIVLHRSGPKKMGEVELAIRFSPAGGSSMLKLVAAYGRPLFPRMHYVLPMNRIVQESLRHVAIALISQRLERAEPPLRAEVVRYMLDGHTTRWSMRRTKANFRRILSVLDAARAVSRWLHDICRWRNTMTTLLVHVLFVILVCYPELILPTVFLYMFLIGAWHYRFRPRAPPHTDVRLSCADTARYEELDEEFDSFPETSRAPDVVKARYDNLRSVGYNYVQLSLGDLAAVGERFQALLSWRDTRATAIFIGFCLGAAVFLYVTPLRLLVLALGLYYLRHPRFRELKPPVLFNFFRRLPTLSDRLL